MKAARTLAVGYAVGLIVLSAIHVLMPQRNGPLALSQVFAPHLFLPLLILLPLALRGAERRTSLALLAAFVIGVVRFGPGMVSLPKGPPGDHGQQLEVLSWNLAAGQVSSELLIGRLMQSDADIVALQELRPTHANAIEADPLLRQQFPYRVLEPESTVLGLGLLSAYPIRDPIASHSPPYLLGVLDLPHGRPLTALTAHPLPPRMRLGAAMIPRRYDTERRDRDLRTIRALVEPALLRGEPVILLGDFNVTDREPGYGELSVGLVDAHRQAGLGPGSTWRPEVLDFLPFGVLRIDYVLTGGPVQPLHLWVDCITNAGDHCSLTGSLAIGP
jgi:vancomycin resistance protein VanJ